MDSSIEQAVEELDDTKPSSSCEPRRRSAVFKRRSIARSTESFQDSESESQDVVKKKKLLESPDPKEEAKGFDLQEYIDSLKAEAKRWQEEYKRRKYRVNELSKCLDKLDKTGGQTLDLACLTDQERSFLNARPDYQEFNLNLLKLHKLATKVAYLDLCTKNQCLKSKTKLAKEEANSTRRIIKLVD